MKELVVASGKGGTGKTSLVGSFAELAGRVVLVDCDVDAANLHLIIHHHTRQEHDFTTSHRARILPEACTACGICADHCRFEAIVQDTDEDACRVEPFACEGCGLCVQLCPEKAIVFEPVISGRWFRSESDYGPFLHAKLGVAQSNSGRLVSLLRQEARRTATIADQDLILVDGPPGIGCPVIAAITNASYLLIVTEPSVSAFHDMERLIRVAEHFGIPAGVCINKSDINDELTGRIERFAADNGLTVHGKLMFDPAVTQAQVRGEPYVRLARGERLADLQRLWQSVEQALVNTRPPAKSSLTTL